MCCIFFCLTHPDFGLVLISNRDEYLKRPSAPSQWHCFPSPSKYTTEGSSTQSIAHVRGDERDGEASSSSEYNANRPVMSGIDAHPAGGGTWLGITKSGRLAAITNFTETAPPPLPQGRGLEAYRSRGSLVKDWLGRQGKADPDEIETYLNSVASHMDEWPGFNLLVGQISSKATIGYVSNRSGKSDSVYLESFIETGSGGLSNSCLQEPWNKVSMGKGRVDEALSRYDAHKAKQGIDQNAAEDGLMSELYKILEENVEITKRDDFKKSIQIPPLRLVNDAWYATRTATVLLVRRDGHVRWWEKDVYVLSPEEEPIKAEAMQLPPRYYEWQL